MRPQDEVREPIDRRHAGTGGAVAPPWSGKREWGITLAAAGFCGRIAFAENRFPLFRTML
jgi:hypothetical protein